MRTHYDKKTDAFYIYFQRTRKKVKKTIKMEDFFLVDIDEKGKVCGIEILDASFHIPLKNFSIRRTQPRKKAD